MRSGWGRIVCGERHFEVIARTIGDPWFEQAITADQLLAKVVG